MQVENCPKNVRCDTLNCHKFALFNIDTNGYKRNICLCESCFDSLFSSMKKAKQAQKSNKTTT